MNPEFTGHEAFSETITSNLAPNTKFYWRVRSVNDVGGVEYFSAWSAVRTFRTNQAINQLLYPAC